MKDHNIFIFDYPFDLQLLRKEYQSRITEFVPYTGRTQGIDIEFSHWKILREIEFEYATYLCKVFDVEAKPRFYIQDPNTTLDMHRDIGTQCSINVLLDSQKPASVDFQDKSYKYSQCLLNVQNLHGVTTSEEPRVLFKLSIFNESFEEVYKKIKKKI